MASIIKVDRILDSTEIGKVDIPGGVETTELVANTWKNVDGTENYKCKCWINLAGNTTPPTIRASGNVSSVVRNGTGDFTFNFNTPMEDTNYAVVATGIGGGANYQLMSQTNHLLSPNSMRCVFGFVSNVSGGVNPQNPNNLYIAVFR